MIEIGGNDNLKRTEGIHTHNLAQFHGPANKNYT